jgi:lysozyme family protein
MANYKNIIPLIRKEEGGLSKATTDKAHLDPVPDGSGYHTNKGITWSTFKTSAPKCGFVATPELFYAMPDYVWEAIFKHVFWDAIQGDKIESQAIADTLFDWSWASGAFEAIKEIQRFMKIAVDGVMGPLTLKWINSIAAANEQRFNDEFSAYKLNWYLSLGPEYEANFEGWKNRLAMIHAFTNSEIKKP